MAAAPLDDWRSPEKRRGVIQKLEEAVNSLQGAVPSHLQNPVELEKTLFEKSKSAEEYSTYIRNVILVVARQKNMQNQQAGQMSHQQGMGGGGRGMGVPGMHPGGAGTGPGGGGAGGAPGAGAAMMPGGMNPRPAGMGMAPGNYPYQGGMGPAAQGQMGGMGMQPRPAAPPQYNQSMYQQPGQMPGMPNRFVGGQPGYQGMQAGANYPPQSMAMMQQPGSYPAGGRYPGGGQMMMSGGGGAPGMGMRMPMAMRTQMPPGRVIPGPGGVAMMNNQPMAVPNRMGGNPAAGYNMIESGVQPVRTIPNPSYPTPRPPGAPQLPQSQGSGVLSPYNSAMAGASPSQQQQQQQLTQVQTSAPSSSLPSSSVSGPSSSQQSNSGAGGNVAGSDQQGQTGGAGATAAGGGAAASGVGGGGAGGGSGGQIGNPPTPHPAREMPVPSPAPPTPLLPASPATSGIGSPAQQPLMTPEDNEAYLRKLNELQRYTPLLSKWITRLSQSQGDNRRGDQIVRLKSLFNLLNNEQRRVPLATLMKCEAALVKMFDQSKEKESHDAAQNAQSAQIPSGGPPSIPPPPSNQSLPPSSTVPPSSSSSTLAAATSSLPPAGGGAGTTATTNPSSSSSALPSLSSLPHPPAEPVVPQVKLINPSKSKSLMDFKMIPSPPPTCGNLMETIQAKPLPPERVPPAKRLCNRDEPSIPPSLLRELAVLDHFKIKRLPRENQFDKSMILQCSLEDSGLPDVPALTVTIPPKYPSVSPICNLSHYHNHSLPFLKSVGKMLSEKLMRSHWTYSLSLLLTSWEDSVLRAMARELTSLEE